MSSPATEDSAAKQSNISEKLCNCCVSIKNFLLLVHKKRHLYRLLCIGAAFLLILILSLSLPVSTITNDKSYAHVLGVTACMSVLWITNAIHPAIVALIPVYMFPLLGVESGSAVSRSYIDSVSMTFIGGFILALTLERWNLQKRIALWIITNVLHYEPFDSLENKSKYKVIRFFKFLLYKFYAISNIHRIPLIYVCFVTVTFLLSGILSNTACALIMVPNAITIIKRLESALVTQDPPKDDAEEKKRIAPLAGLSTALLLGVAYSSTIGGVMTLIGTPTNLLFARQMESLKKSVSFFQWLLIGIPIGCAIQIFITLFLLVVYVIPSWYKIRKMVNEIKKKKREEELQQSHSINLPDIHIEVSGIHHHLEHAEHDASIDNLASKLSNSISPESKEENEAKDELNSIPISSPTIELSPVSPSNDENNNKNELKKSESQEIMLKPSISNNNMLNVSADVTPRSSIDSTRPSLDDQTRVLFQQDLKKSDDQNGSENIDIEVFKKEYQVMGRITFEEVIAILFFALTIFFWTTRSISLGDFKGWDVLFKSGYVGEGTVAILFASILFIIPSYHTPPEAYKMDPQSASVTHSTLMDWKIMNKFPWDMLLLFGGGFAIADGFTKSGLNTILASQLEFLKTWNSFGIIALVSLIVTVLTAAITSNTATIQIFLPILSGLATTLGVNPALLLAPAALCCSYAFELPVSTPPNAIAYTYSEGRITVVNMLFSGTILALYSYGVTVVICYFLVPVVFPA